MVVVCVREAETHDQPSTRREFTVGIRGGLYWGHA